MVRVTRLPTVLSFVFNPKIDSHQRAIMLGLVSLICLSLFHYLWLWNRLLENNESSFWLFTGDDPWVQDVKKVLQCRKSPRHSWYSIDTARALYSRPPAKRQQSSSSSSSSSSQANDDDDDDDDKDSALWDIYRQARQIIPSADLLRHLLQILPFPCVPHWTM